MNPIYEDVSTATENYSRLNSPTVTIHKGRKYQAVGESYGNVPFNGKRFLHILAVIGLVAVSILLLGTPIFFSHKFRVALVGQIQQARGVNVHYVPRVPDHWQKVAIGIGACEWIRVQFEPHSLREEIFESVALCIRLAFEGGEVKKQFVFKNQNQIALTRNVLSKESNKIKESLMKLLDGEINLDSPYIAIDHVFLFKDRKGRISVKEMLGETRYAEQADKSASYKVMDFKNMDEFDYTILDGIGFSNECIGPDGNFIEGKFYHNPI